VNEDFYIIQPRQSRSKNNIEKRMPKKMSRGLRFAAQFADWLLRRLATAFLVQFV